MLVGPTALALVEGDAAAAAKVLSDTARALRGPLEFKGGFMSGAVLSAEDVEAIAKLPSRDVLNGQLVGTIAAPLTGLARTLNALIAGVAIQLGQIRDQGLVSVTQRREAPAAEAEAAPPSRADASLRSSRGEAAPSTAAEASAAERELRAEAQSELSEPI